MRRDCIALILFRTGSIHLRQRTCRLFQKRKCRAGMNRSGVTFGRGGDSSTRRHFELGANARRDLRRVVIDEVTDAVMRDAPQLGPVAERGDGGLFVFRENPAATQADDVREPIF